MVLRGYKLIFDLKGRGEVSSLSQSRFEQSSRGFQEKMGEGGEAEMERSQGKKKRHLIEPRVARLFAVKTVKKKVCIR